MVMVTGKSEWLSVPGSLNTDSDKQTLTIRVRTSKEGAVILRKRCIYCLPNGHELVVLQNDEERVLFGPVNSERWRWASS